MSETSGTPQAPAPQGTRPSTPRSVRPREAGDYPLEEFIESRGFRPEIQGLRAFAVLLVVLYHVWFGKVSGGVDVFLFISAFLLSLSFMRKINEGKWRPFVDVVNAESAKNGIKGTPTVFVDGDQYTSNDFSAFLKSKIEAKKK